jgi:hypothetical protein
MPGITGHIAFVSVNAAAVNDGKRIGLRNLGGVAGLPQLPAGDARLDRTDIVKCKQRFNAVTTKWRYLAYECQVSQQDIYLGIQAPAP